MAKKNLFLSKFPFLIALVLFLSFFKAGFLFAEDKTFKLQVKEGLNFISLPLGTSWDIKSLLLQVNSTKKQAAYWDTANNKYIFYADDKDFNQFSTFEFAKGYWLQLVSPKVLAVTITGVTPAKYTLNLKKGWNSIGSPGLTALPVEKALLPLKLGVDYISVWRYSTPNPPYYQQYSSSKKEFTTINPGEGYWIRMIKDATWVIGNLPPVINSITPANNSIILAGAKVTIEINAIDPNEDTMQYQFSIGGAVKQAWSSSKTYTWQTIEADLGSVSITCEAKDAKGEKSFKTITYKIINPTVQEVLQKVADNYAKITDFKADMTLDVVIDGNNFDKTQYCRNSYKAPNKEKTENFTDSTRNQKETVIISDGLIISLINMSDKNVNQLNLNNDSGATGIQVGQLNPLYDLAQFLQKHNVSKDSLKTDYIDQIIALNIIPLVKTNVYSKLELFVDYKKGIITKILLYQEDELGQTEQRLSYEVLESKQMPDGSWLPNKITKTKNLPSGNLTSNINYQNIQINTGLQDSLFDPTKQ